MKSIQIFAPATIANVNVGFDVLGVALNTLGDQVKLTFNGTKENKITAIINGKNLPFDADKNCCSVVIRKMQKATGVFKGVDVKLNKGFAAGSGLGSSSASSVAAAFGYNELIGTPFTKKELIAFAAQGEKIACGSAHIDNVAPALLGGIVLSKGMKEKDILQLPLIDNLYAVTLLPNIEINTSEARKILKETVAVSSLSKQVALMGTFVSSLYEKDLELFSTALQDLIVEPVRSLLIPKFDELKEAAFYNKALGFGISGSGPAVFAFSSHEKNAMEIQTALERVYEDTGIQAQSYVDALNDSKGAYIIKQRN